jgi:3-methyladenine DNA glycosylase AlkC
MAEPLKHVYNTAFFNTLSSALEDVIKGFNKKAFLRDIHTKDWEQKELKDRMKHIAVVIKKHLNEEDYPKNVKSIEKVIGALRKRKVRENSFEYMFFPHFVEEYGLADFKTSIKALEFITQFSSCEFAIRPFIKQYPKASMDQLLLWSKHESHLVRRLASEGCRPRLPWAMALPTLKKDPTPILPILEHLKADPAEFVRKSVANNLNDIAKDNPDIVLTLAARWKGKSPDTNWIIKHGCRTLLKQAHPEVLALFDLSPTARCEISSLSLTKKTIAIGDHLHFSFELQNLEKKTATLRIEYAIYYMKANQKQNRKLFKITENTYDAGKLYSFQRKQSFQNMTTRKHHVGKHALAIVVNGQELAGVEFMVK